MMKGNSTASVASFAPTHSRVDVPPAAGGRMFALISLSLLFIAFRAAFNLVAQLFKPNEPFSLWVANDGTTTPEAADTRVPWLVALASVSSGPFLVLMSLGAMFVKGMPIRIRNNAKLRLKVYTLLGFLEAVNQIFVSFSVTSLPVAAYAIIKASSVVFSVILFKLFTTKQFNAWQYLAVAVLIISVLVILFDSPSRSSPEGAADEEQPDDHTLGLICGIISALSVSVMGIVSHLFYAMEAKKQDTYDVVEIFVGQTFAAFLFVTPLAIMMEHNTWRHLPGILDDSGKQAEFGAALAGIFMVYPLSMLTLHAVMSYSSAFLPRILSAFRRVIVIALGVLLFNESVERPTKIASITLMIGGTALYVYGGLRPKKGIPRAQKVQDNGSVGDSTVSTVSDDDKPQFTTPQSDTDETLDEELVIV